jgi:hypothetical protein
MFYIITRYDGIEYNYMMRKGEEGPVIDLINSKLTEERNGTEIKIYIKNETDLLKFVTEIKNQLHYFDNVVIDSADIENYYSGNYYSSYQIENKILSTIYKINEEYNIIEGDTFKYRTNTEFSILHMCIGTVYYPIDYQTLGINTIHVPLALKFDIGELSVIQTREDVRYTDVVIKKIKDKIEALKIEVLDRVNSQLTADYTLLEFLEERPFRNPKLKLGEQYISVDPLMDAKKLNPCQIKDLPITFDSLGHSLKFYNYMSTCFHHMNSSNFSNYKLNSMYKGINIDKSFTASMSIKPYKSKLAILPQQFDATKSYYNSFENILTSLESIKNNHYIKIIKANSGKYSVKKNKYILDELHSDWSPEDVYLMSIPDKFNINISTLKIFYKEYCREMGDVSLKEFTKILNYLGKVIKNLIDDIVVEDYDKINPSSEWWKKYRAKNYTTASYDRTQMAIEKLVNCDHSWNRKDYRYNLEELFKECASHKIITILITKEQQSKLCSNNNERSTALEKMFNFLHINKDLTKREYRLFATADRNYNKILDVKEDKHRIYTLEEFIKNEKMQNRILSKIATMVKLQSYIKEFDKNSFGHKFGSMSSLFNIMNSQLEEDYRYVINYIQTLDYDYQKFRFSEEDFKSIVSEFDEVDKSYIVYDQGLISKVKGIIQFLNHSRLNLVTKDIVSMYNFAVKYSADKVYHTLDSTLLKTDIDEKFIIDYVTTKNLSSATTVDELRGNLSSAHFISHFNDSRSSYSYSYSTVDNITKEKILPLLLLMKYDDQNRVDNTIFDFAEEIKPEEVTEEKEEEVDITV